MWQFYFYFLRNLHSGCVNFYASLPPAAPQSPIPQPRPSPTPPYLVPGHSWGSSRQPVHCRSFPHLLSILGVGRHEPPAFPHCHAHQSLGSLPIHSEDSSLAQWAGTCVVFSLEVLQDPRTFLWGQWLLGGLPHGLSLSDPSLESPFLINHSI